MKYKQVKAIEIIKESGLDINESDEINESFLSMIAELAERTNEINDNLAKLASHMKNLIDLTTRGIEK